MLLRILLLVCFFATQATALEVNGELKNAVVEKFATDPVTGLITGRIYFNTVTNTTRLYDGAVWRNSVNTDSTQTLTNKTIAGASNTITVLAASQLSGAVPIANGGTGAATKATGFDALSPMTTAGDLVRGGASGTGTRVAVGVEGQSLRVVSGVPAWADGGSGSGALNLITNPSAASDATTGVTNGTSHTTARVSGANSPLNTAIPTAFELTATTTAVESATSGVRWTYTVPAAIRNTNLRVGFSYTVQASQTWSVSVRNTAGRLVLNTDVSSASILANSTATVTGNFTAAFDSDSDTGNYTVNITRTAGAGTAILYVTNLSVDAGTIINAPAIGPWQSWTPTGSWTANTTYVGRHRRVGTNLHVQVAVALAGAPTTAAFSVNLPPNHTMDGASLAGLGIGSSTQAVGTVRGRDSGVVDYTGVVTVAAGSININSHNTSDVWSQAIPFSWNNLDSFSMDFTVPITEFAGAPNYAGQNDVEYSWNSSGITAANTSNTIAFAYGPGGAAIGSIASTTNGATEMRVRFQTPIQVTDVVLVQIAAPANINSWTTVGSITIPASYSSQGAARYGVGLQVINTTDVDVLFGNNGARSTNASYAGNGDAWSGYSTYLWRVVKSRSGVAQGFGASAQGRLGLVSAGQVPGTNTNDTATAGNVGQVLRQTRVRASSVALTSGVTRDAIGTALTLTAGQWLVSGMITLESSAASTVTAGTTDIGISLTTATPPATSTISVPTLGEVGVRRGEAMAASQVTTHSIAPYIFTTTGTSLFLVVSATTTGTVSVFGSIEAVRIR